MKRQMGQNKSQRLCLNCKKLAERNGIYMSQSKTSTNTQTEENDVKVRKKNLSLYVDRWMKVISSNES